MNAPDRPIFELSDEALRELADDCLRQARALGATDAVAEVSEGSGLAVTVRKGKVETIEQTRDKGLGVTVHVGQRRGHASTSDFSPAARAATVRAAYDIARHTGEDAFAGLPDEDTIEFSPPDLDLFHPWSIDAARAVEIAQATEAAAFDTSPLIRNSEGASVNVGHGRFVAANTRGFVGGYPYSRHSIAVSPIAGRGAQMQRDDWYTSSREPDRLGDPAAIGRYAAERALSRLHARRIPTCKVPVLFESPLALGLLGHFAQAASGAALYRQSTFLNLDAMHRPLFAGHVDVDENPHVPREMGSAPFDDEGCVTRPRTVVEGGVLRGWFLSTYSARKLGLKTTGNAGGSHRLTLSSRRTKRGDDLRAMLRKLGTGLFVTDLMGQGVNYVTGDYSRGASGFWVERGEIAYPVEEITIAGNLREMFLGIAAVGSDVIQRGGKRSGSVLIESMAVAGT